MTSQAIALAPERYIKVWRINMFGSCFGCFTLAVIVAILVILLVIV